MMKKFTLTSLLLCAVCIVQAEDTLRINLQQAIQMGLDSSRNLRISQTRLDIARAKYNQALDATIPSVRLSGNYTRLSDIEMPKILFPGATEPVALFPVYLNNYSAGVSVSETVFSGFRLKYARESQQLLQQASTFDFQKDKEDIALNIATAYLTIYKIQTSLRLIDEELKQIQERVRVTAISEKNGLATHNDLLRWQLQESNIQLTGIDLRNNLDVANYNFNLMLGTGKNVVIIPDSTDLNRNDALNTLDSYMASAQKSRADLLAADLRSKAMYNNLKVAENSDLPRLTVGADFLDARPNQRFIPPVDAFRFTWSVGLSLSWDLVSLYSNRHNVDEARAVYRQNAEGLGLLSDGVKAEINQNYLSYKQSMEKINVMQKSVEQAEENFRLMDSRYKNSLVTLSELLEANTTLLSSRINFELARADRQIAYYRLQKSVSSITKTSSK